MIPSPLRVVLTFVSVTILVMAATASASTEVEIVKIKKIRERCSNALVGSWNAQALASGGNSSYDVTTKVGGVESVKNILRTNRSYVVLASSWSQYTNLLQPEQLAVKDILDVGTGGGDFVFGLLEELSDKNLPLGKIVGLDLVLTRQQKSKPELFVEGSAFRMPFADSSFDIVFSNESVFSYYQKPEDRGHWERAVSEAYRVLKNGGLLMFNFGFWFNRDELDRDRAPFEFL